MKIRSPFLLGLAAVGTLALLPSADAQNSAVTPPAGFHTLEVPAGGSSHAAVLRQAIEFQGQGTVGTTGANSTIDQPNAGFTAGEFDNHYIEILEGANTGAVLDIVSNTETQLTVNGDLSAFGFAGGSTLQYSVREHQTLSSYFPNGGGFGAFSDTITIFGSDGTSSAYLWDGTQWIDAGTFAPADPILYPDTGFVVNASGALDVRVTGHVHWDTATDQIAQSIVPIYGGAVNIVATSNPIADTTDNPSTIPLSAFNFPASLAAFADTVTLYDNTGALNVEGQFLSDGTNMIDAGTFANADATPIPVVRGLILNAAGDANLVFPPQDPGN